MVSINPSWIQLNEKTEYYEVRIKRDGKIFLVGNTYKSYYDASKAYVNALIKNIAISRKEREL